MDLEVRTGALNTYAEKERSVKHKLDIISSQLLTCRSQIKSGLSSSASVNIDRALGNIHSRLIVSSKKVNNMASALDTIARMYSTTEKNISGSKPSGEAVKAASGGSGSVVDKVPDIVWKLLKAGFSKAGVLGLIAGGVLDITTGKMDWIKALGLGNKIVAKSFEKASGKISWKELITGAKKVGEKAKPKGIAQRLNKFKGEIGDEIGEYSVKKSLKKAAGDGAELTAKQTKAITGKVVTKWLGSALTVADKVKKNWAEFKYNGGIKNERFWKETVTESAIEIGKDLLIGTAVAVVIGAGGWVPALLGAAITVGVNVGLDAGAKAITGKDFTESISDGLIDLDEKINANKKSKRVNTIWSGGGNLRYAFAR